MRIALKDRFWAKVEVLGPNQCWRWIPGPGSKRLKYGQIGRGGADGGMALAHRVSYELNVGPIPDGLCVLHRCDNRLCVNPQHLFLGTIADNHADMRAKGRQADTKLTRHCGESHGRAKLSAVKVSAIRNSPTSAKLVAPKFGISASQVWRIRRCDAWKFNNNLEAGNVRHA